MTISIPPGAGRQIIERTCIRCHGPDFLPNHQWDADQWNAAIDLMQSTELNVIRPAASAPQAFRKESARKSARPSSIIS